MTDTTPDLPAAPDRGRPDPVMVLLRAENAAALAAALAAYAVLGAGWPLFAALILAPDLAMLAYRIDPRWGARFYNATHTYVLPAALGAVGWGLGSPALPAAALVWIAHIALDRALGFGLKRPGSFRDTHLGALRGSAPARGAAPDGRAGRA